MGGARFKRMSQFEQLPAAAMVRARPWDVIGAGLAAPMLLWGFLSWFGTVGDSGGGTSGYYSGAGAAGIGLVLAAAALMVNQLLSGRPHDRSAPPVGVLLATAAAIVILGGMVAKPDSSTIQAGSVAGLLTALSQAAVLVRGWLKGSQKTVKAANVRALNARQEAADLAAGIGTPGYQAYPAPGYGAPPYGAVPYGATPYGAPAYGAPAYGAPTYRPSTSGQPVGYPQPGYPHSGPPQGGYPAPGYPAAGYPPGYPVPAGPDPRATYPHPAGPANRSGPYPPGPDPRVGTGQPPGGQAGRRPSG